MDFFDVVRMRRSVRQFRSEPVSRAALEKIVAAGIEAPSGANAQLRQYVIVDDPAVLAQLRQASKALESAPAAIVLVLALKATPYGEFWIQDASAAMQNMLLAAVALGYAGCWVEGAIRGCEEQLRQALGVPEPLRVWSVMPVGSPAVAPPRPAKSSPAEVVHYNRFGNRKVAP
jgi:nitroreductase